jgi:hypothetical protein
MTGCPVSPTNPESTSVNDASPAKLPAVLAVAIVVSLLGLAALSYAQFFRGGRRQAVDRSDYPMWEIPPAFKHDTFTFVRIQYDSYGGARGGGGWSNDFPDCDWNFSYRLQQLTSMEVDPNGRVMRLDDDDLSSYPFIFMSNVQGMSLSASEEKALQTYLLNGGFLMADDFWTAAAWRHVKQVMNRVLPGCEPRELTVDHEIFNIVYRFDSIPRVLSIKAWERGLTYEDWYDWSEPQDKDPHFRAYFDANDRMVALFCQNSDVGDGWEREGENHEFFEEFSVKVSYPLGINIVTYAMTH